MAEQGEKRDAAAMEASAAAPPKERVPIKKNVSAFLHFCGAERESVKKERPSAGVGEVTKVLSERWKSLDAPGKEKYAAIAAEDKRRRRAAREAPRGDAAGGDSSRRRRGRRLLAATPREGRRSRCDVAGDDAMSFELIL